MTPPWRPKTSAGTLSASLDRDHSQRAAGLEREPHQRDVLERVSELADGDREIDTAEVPPAQERGSSLWLWRHGHGASLPGGRS